MRSKYNKIRMVLKKMKKVNGEEENRRMEKRRKNM